MYSNYIREMGRSMAAGKRWTRDELILALNIYCKIPSSRLDDKHPEVIKLANYLGRTPGSVGLKLANFVSIDPTNDKKGMSNHGKLDEVVWNEFFTDSKIITFESEEHLNRIFKENIEEQIGEKIFEGKEREAIVKNRVNQNLFRRRILINYNSKCCFTSLPSEKLLIASHIVPWSKDKENRLNPKNGLCLNSLFDKAFDSGLITVDESYRMVISSKLTPTNNNGIKLITAYEGKEINKPVKYYPSQEFLEYHREKIFVA
jgi:predicted restriction endonuclease